MENNVPEVSETVQYRIVLIQKIHGIEIQLSQLNDMMANHSKLDSDLFTKINNMLSIHETMIFGDKNLIGLREEMNLLKKIGTERQAHLNILTGAIIIAVVNSFFWFIKKLLGGVP